MISLRMFQVVGSAQHFDDWYTAALVKKYCFTWKNNTVSLGKTILFNWKKTILFRWEKQYCFNTVSLGKITLFHWEKQYCFTGKKTVYSQCNLNQKCKITVHWKLHRSIIPVFLNGVRRNNLAFISGYVWDGVFVLPCCCVYMCMEACTLFKRQTECM